MGFHSSPDFQRAALGCAVGGIAAALKYSWSGWGAVFPALGGCIMGGFVTSNIRCSDETPRASRESDSQSKKNCFCERGIEGPPGPSGPEGPRGPAGFNKVMGIDTGAYDSPYAEVVEQDENGESLKVLQIGIRKTPDIATDTFVVNPSTTPSVAPVIDRSGGLFLLRFALPRAQRVSFDAVRYVADMEQPFLTERNLETGDVVYTLNLPPPLPGPRGLRGERGLQGERGPQGLQGPQGERGPAGPAPTRANTQSVSVIQSLDELRRQGGRAILNANCPSGKTAAGGKCFVSYGHLDPQRSGYVVLEAGGLELFAEQGTFRQFCHFVLVEPAPLDGFVEALSHCMDLLPAH